ncbi:septal ring lytic transglycosylase RlpA family protein [Sphingomicrobium sp. XHP0239]|uniref:septal ring lytic transglycosylase RlpA family protein n=1 Tax=Sphingomicrobium maritimum TaxID=3133972 RepID=UPI0031CC7E3A
MTQSTIQLRKRDRFKRLFKRAEGGPRRRTRLAIYASVPAMAVAGFAPAEPVDAGDILSHELTLRSGDVMPADAVPVDFSTLAADEEETASAVVDTAALTPVGASYYGARFAGRPTANGERFDPSAMTAAHRTLPFGTMVEVTNTANGKTVTVRINDRGPFHGNRAIDLSRGAAEKIGMIASGHGTVTIRTIS